MMLNIVLYSIIKKIKFNYLLYFFLKSMLVRQMCFEQILCYTIKLNMMYNKKNIKNF